MPTIAPGPTVRRSPFHEATVAEGVTEFSVYNHMLMPVSYGDPQAEYRRLTEGVALWDVGCERQVEVRGADAERLVQALVPRRIANLPVGAAWYVPVCDHRGVLLNDPVLLRLDEDRFWLSIADLDLLPFVRAVAAERGMEVEIAEPDVSPLAVQGPLAEEVVAALFDDSVRQMGRFRFREVDLDGIPLVLCRSGWSHQGGFELFLQDASRGSELWLKVREAGLPFGIGPGAPNEAERIESGLLSWRGDCDDRTTPWEVRLGRYVDLDAPDDTVGIRALRRARERGPNRHQMGVVLDHDQPLPEARDRAQVFRGMTMAGQMTARAWSPRLGANIGLCLIWTGVGPGDEVRIVDPDGTEFAGEVRDLPFL